MQTLSDFLGRFGGRLLLTTDDLVHLLNHTDRGLKTALYRPESELAQLLAPHRIRIGRKVLFRTIGVGLALGLIDPCEQPRDDA